jgi:hypothetical protein
VADGDMWLGADSVEVDGTEPRPNNAAGGLSMHLVMHGSGASTIPRVPGCRGSTIAGFPLLTAPTYQLEIGGGQCRAGMFASCYHR